ncbi:putative uncharacterized protein DDB_G0292330 [Ptychodera flava]|uniref:putative uncharacterized protein DDB_G0292330 n=1 Tax=Ptychodera flava TaxID=63121 RepID=UPI00396AA69E
MSPTSATPVINNGKLYTASFDGSIKIWDVDDIKDDITSFGNKDDEEEDEDNKEKKKNKKNKDSNENEEKDSIVEKNELESTEKLRNGDEKKDSEKEFDDDDLDAEITREIEEINKEMESVKDM